MVKKVAAKKVAKKVTTAPKKAAPKKVVAKKVATPVKKVTKPVVAEKLIEKIKYKAIGNSLNVIIEGKTLTKKSDKETINTIKEDIAKYNKFEGKKSNLISQKLRTKIENAMKTEVVKKENEINEKKTSLRTQKKIIKKAIKEEPKAKEEAVKPKLTLSEMIEIERESKKTLTIADRGYIHPVTGRYWNGENYV